MEIKKEIQQNVGSSVERDDDAMFIKKSLAGPIPEKCMACDQPIHNAGHVADYKPWKKLPLESVERTSKVRLVSLHLVRSRLFEGALEDQA